MRSAIPFVAVLCGLRAVAGPVDAVNPFIGTEADGHCWPGATVPFALVQPGPDNGYEGWDYVAGYRQRDPRILGFSQTHNPGGGGPIYGDIGIMPDGDDGRKASEEAHPGYYRVTFTSGTSVEITATDHGACYRLTFPGRQERADVRRRERPAAVRVPEELRDAVKRLGGRLDIHRFKRLADAGGKCLRVRRGRSHTHRRGGTDAELVVERRGVDIQRPDHSRNAVLRHAGEMLVI